MQFWQELWVCASQEAQKPSRRLRCMGLNSIDYSQQLISKADHVDDLVGIIEPYVPMA
jgi:hypothetical protein